MTTNDNRRDFLKSSATAAFSGIAIAGILTQANLASGQETKTLTNEQVKTKRSTKTSMEEVAREAKTLLKQATAGREETIPVKRETVERIANAFLSLSKAARDQSGQLRTAAATDDYGILCDYFPRPTDFLAD